MRLARLRALFDRYDVDKSGTLGANALDHMLTELGGRDDASAGGGLLLAEFGDADGTDGRALSFAAFVRLVTKLESEAAEPRDDETTAAPARPISELMPRFSLSVVRAVTGGDDDTSTRAHPHQTATDETHQNVGVSPPAAPRAPPAPGEEPAATKSVIDDDAALAPPPPPSAVAPPPPQPAAAPPPARLKDGSGIRRSGDSADLFVLERFLASGGCGEVYRARQVETGGRFALKRVLVASQGTARWKDELSHCAEANVMLQLSRHENVMTMQYCIVFASEFFMFFDLIDGARDVDGTIKSGELYKGESGDAVRARSLSIITQAAVAIAFVNEQGVLHEDVKHENVMVDSRWHVKLVDFGFATQGSGFGASLRATFTGATPDFMSPETSELKKRLASLKERGDWEGYLEVKRTVLLSVPETDGWAWGIMAHAMLTCNEKLNSAANSLSELQRKTATALCREWGAGEIDEWARSLPMAGATKKVCAAIADSLKDVGLQDGLSLLALRPHNDEQTEDLRKAFKLRKAPGPSRGKIFQKALLAPSPPLRSLLERCFAARPSDRPASMDEVAHVLINECGASASEASNDVTGDDTGRAGSLYNLGASLVEKAHDPARVNTEQTADAGVLQRAVGAFGGAGRLAPPESVMRADARSMEGAVLLLSSEPAKAEAAFEAALRVSPQHGRALFNLAACRSERAGAAEGAAADAMFVRAAATGEMQQSDLRAFVAPSTDDASTDQAAAYLLWFLREHATLRDGVSGRTHAIGDVCVNLTLSEAKTREHASVALSGSEEPKGAWAGPAALAADALLPHGLSLRFNRKVLVLARAASGKSVVLAQLGVAMAGAPSDGEDSAEQRVLPLKIPLVALGSIMRQTTSEGAAAGGVGLLRRYLSEHEKFTPPRVECLARSLSHGAMLLLLDGLDEATTQVESVLRWVDEMLAAHPRLRVVLSSRPVTGVDPSAMGARGFRILQVQPLASSQMRDAVGKRVGDAAIADRIMTQIDEGGLSVLASNPLMLGLIAHTLADSSDGHVVDAASLATQTAVTTRALDGMVARARGGGSATGVSVDVRVMMSDVARLAAGSLLRRMLAELMLEAHVRRTREVTASDAAAALTAARATTHEADGASVARLTAAVWLCARARLVPPLEPRGDASVGCFHLIPQETLAAEALAVRLRTAASTAARGDTAAALAAAARAALGGDDLSRLDEAWWHPVVIALFEQLSNDAADDTMAKDALLETIASRRPEPLVKGMRVEYYDETFNRYLPGKLTATPSPDSALVELADWNDEPLTGFERRRLRRVPKEGGAATMARAAAAAGATSFVSELVARGVDVATTVDPESLDGALHLATRFGRAETARMLLEEGGGCWPEQQNKLRQRPVDMAAACAVVAARPALSRVYFPPACDLELAQQRRCDAAGGGNERWRQWRAAAERGDADAVRRLVATEPLPETTASDAARDETTKVAGTLAYDPRWPSQQSYAPGDCVFAREAAEGGGEGARWRRGVVTAKHTDGDMTVAFDDGSKSGYLPPSALRLDDRSSDCGVTALMIAAARADAATVTALLLAPPLAPAATATAVGARTSRRGCLALHFASVGGSATVVDILLSRAADSAAQVNATQGADGASALYLASKYGHAAVVKRLLGAGAAVDQADNNGRTPLCVASENGHTEAIAALLGAGAAVDQANNNGTTPLYVASQNGHTEAIAALLGAGAAVDQAANGGYTPLWVASQNGHTEAIAALLGAGAAVDQADNDGTTPLFVASHNGHTEAIAALLGAGAAVDQAANGGLTPLFATSYNGHTEAIAALLGAGAAVDQADNDGWTPLFIASQSGHTDAVKLLRAHGASATKCACNIEVAISLCCCCLPFCFVAPMRSVCAAVPAVCCHCERSSTARGAVTSPVPSSPRTAPTPNPINRMV